MGHRYTCRAVKTYIDVPLESRGPRRAL